MDLSPHDIISRLQRLEQDRHNIEQIWALIERFITPFRIKMFGDEVDWTLRDLYDATAIKANYKLAAHLHGALTNPMIEWFSLELDNPDLRKNSIARQWEDEMNVVNFTSLQNSNFDIEVNEGYLSLTSFGAECMMNAPIEDIDGSLDRIDYKTIPINECFFETDSSGYLINFYRKMKWTATEIVEKFGDQAPEEVKKDIELNNTSKKYEIIFCIYKQEVDKDYDPFVINAVENRLFQGRYIFTKTKEVLGEKIGFHEQPVFIALWGKTAGSEWGHSPSMVAIWDVLTLNQLVKLILTANEKVVDPTILTTKRGVFGDIDLSSGGVLVVSDIEKSIKAFESSARFDVSALEKRDLIEAINSTYYVDELQLKESPAMTATEVNARIQMMQRLIGPTLGRIRRDLLEPLVTRHFMINYRYKKFPELPDIIKNSGTGLKVRYEGAMAKAQRYEKAASVERWLSVMGQLTAVYPSMTDIPDTDAIARYLGEQEGIPENLMHSKEEVESVRQQRAKEAALRADIERKAMAGQAAQQMGKGIKELKGEE